MGDVDAARGQRPASTTKTFALRAAGHASYAFGRVRQFLQRKRLHSGESKRMRQKRPLRNNGPIIGLTAGLAILVGSPASLAQSAEQPKPAADQPDAKPAATSADDVETVVVLSLIHI